MVLPGNECRWQRHEILLSALGWLTTGALFLRAGPACVATLSTAIATAAFCLFVFATSRSDREFVQKCRYIAAFFYVLWFYNAIRIVVPVLQDTLYDETLLEIDEQFFGVTPSVPWQAWSSVFMNELMSGCYLTYLIYLHVCVVHSWLMPLAFTRRFANGIYSTYVIGLSGYLLYPAIGPKQAFRELYGPDLQGPVLTPLNQWIVENGSSVYDAFPSLHVLITMALIDFDRQNVRRRFYWMVFPVIGIIFSAIYLRYHYAIDLLIGGSLFLVAKMCFTDEEIRNVETGFGE